MSTGLSIIKREEFSILSGADSELEEALLAQREAGVTLSAKDLIRVKTPTGGATKWAVGDKLVPEIIGAFVGYQRCSVLWPSEQAQLGQMPCLRSWDGITAEQVGPMPPEMEAEIEKFVTDETTDEEGRVVSRKYQISPESGFPYTQWGTGKGGRGKRMKDQRIVFILQKDDPAPLYIIVQPFSFKVFDKWFSQIVQMHRVPWYRLVVGLSLQAKPNSDGQETSIVTPRTVGVLERDTAAKLQEMFGMGLKQAAKDASVASDEE